MTNSGWLPSLLSGASAGLAVDVSLFPLDTIKTRLQSKQGFQKSGGFRGVYKGIGPVIFGSAPGAAIFFVAYDTSKGLLERTRYGSQHKTMSYMASASVGEVIACVVRVPTEVIKQRSQTMAHKTSLNILRETIRQEKLHGLFRGYRSTVMREIPFSFIQFPLWEYAKQTLAKRQNKPVSPWQGAWCGFFSGGFAAAVTTPLDVAKTRIMLAQRKDKAADGRMCPVLQEICRTKGVKGLFAGIVPRVTWISVGGFVFLGTYDFVTALLTRS